MGGPTTIRALEERGLGRVGIGETDKREREGEFDIDIGDRHMLYVPRGSYLTAASLGPVRTRCVV